VDDQGHPHDLARLTEEVLARVDAPVPEDVRRWQQRDFFAFHLQRYSKSRRKAPIYWPLSTISGSYTLWFYYPSLTSQTLYTAINDFVEPKLKQVGAEVTALDPLLPPASLTPLVQCAAPRLVFAEGPAQLAQAQAALGADVPVFVHGHAAFAEGVGEKLTAVELDEPWFLVAIPQVTVSTAEVFSDPELTRDTPANKLRSLLEGGGRNDCQPVVQKRYAEVDNALILLNKFVPARLTGTGACVFGSFPNQDDADKVARQLPATLPCFVAQGRNVSMLHRKLRELAGK